MMPKAYTSTDAFTWEHSNAIVAAAAADAVLVAVATKLKIDD